jgi:CRP/FNR family cyclic AMP-dependent transcriptional regulator
VNLLKSGIQDELRALPDATRLGSLQRCTSLFAQSQTADAVFLIDEGLVKLTKTNETGAKIILAICGPGQLIGEEALSENAQTYYTEAVALTSATVQRIPGRTVSAAIGSSPELGSALIGYLLHQKLLLAEKVELLCLKDVEHRILHYLAELSNLLPQGANGDGHQIPITQLELADLIGATRETTSTTLNQLERRGLLRLSRRLLTVPSAEVLRSAANSARASVSVVANGAAGS